ncbi:MAG: Tex family protein [Myxococcota bacterium]
MSMDDLARRLGTELDIGVARVRAVLALFDDGSTVPFVARYRKEQTGGLDETRLRAIAERRSYLVELDRRRDAILASMRDQGVLTAERRTKLEAATTNTALEDLYAPYRPRRRTRGATARERGLSPLADLMWSQGMERPSRAALRFVDPDADVGDGEQALAGARDICAERLADDAVARERVRSILARHGSLVVRKVAKHKDRRTKFDDHAGRDEPYRRIASHRYLALCRGEAEKILRVGLRLDNEQPLLGWLERHAGVTRASPWAEQLQRAVADGLKRLLLARAESDLRAELRSRADRDAVAVFAANLRDLLLAAPFGEHALVAIDPGQRTGAKCVALDATGRLLAHDTMYLVHGEAKLTAARATLRRLLQRADARAVAVGNGTHGRETEAFVRDLLHEDGADLPVVSVSEAGASVYSASEVAVEELGHLDVVFRGAVSIGRRLQDPLAELVKIDPGSIGVGQYQHDVPPALLAQRLDAVVEDCVNRVGVNLNHASPALLARVAGLGPQQARAVVAFRERHGRYNDRRELLEVPGIGPRSFEQAAGFLRIDRGRHPLDASAVHPEQYPLVERMARDLELELDALVGDVDAIRRLQRSRYDDVGRYTLDDVLAELAKPGRDPRRPFEAPSFRADVKSIDDLSEGMALEGLVTNVTDFGAFVDVGVKQDGLVHISELADRFVRDPRAVVRVGQRLQVTVLRVERDRKRIALSAKSRRSG